MTNIQKNMMCSCKQLKAKNITKRYPLQVYPEGKCLLPSIKLPVHQLTCYLYPLTKHVIFVYKQFLNISSNDQNGYVYLHKLFKTASYCHFCE